MDAELLPVRHVPFLPAWQKRRRTVKRFAWFVQTPVTLIVHEALHDAGEFHSL